MGKLFPLFEMIDSVVEKEAAKKKTAKQKWDLHVLTSRCLNFWIQGMKSRWPRKNLVMGNLVIEKLNYFYSCICQIAGVRNFITAKVFMERRGPGLRG
ncbi:MAG: hypothetical protein DMG65_24645 [Candidatus Angelobacter sp. Gp1-AA117]|nr:MAG: hypothetical protein DMG65_24645 [Candidatus Angelobacter sp. Gp1-AA117]